MRREEAEERAAARNASDGRRGRLEFYAFDASAGLAHDAWEVTMRLRGPGSAGVAPPPEAPRPRPDDAIPFSQDELAAQRRARQQARAAARRGGAGAPARVRSSHPRPSRSRAPVQRRRRPESAQRRAEGRRLRLPLRRRDGRPATPRIPLGRTARLVGALLIAVAVVWVGLVTALAVLVHADSPSGLAVYAAAVCAGLLAAWLGLRIRRA